MGKPESHLYEFGRFRLDTAERVLLRSGETVPLTPKAFETLVVLVRNGGHVVTKEELMREVWPDTFVEEGGLARNISVLRRALDEDSSARSFIETVPKFGYRFAAPVRELTDATELAPGTTARELTPAADATLVVERHTRTSVVVEDEEADEPLPASPVGAPRALPAGRGGTKWAKPALAALCALLVAAGGVLYYFWRQRAQGDEPGFRSIAVLPFRPLGASGGADEYLRLGLADALITKLSNVKQIAVRPTSAVRKYLSAEQDPQVAGRELGVDVVLEGSVQHEGERVRVTVQLVGVRDGKPAWAGAFDEKFTDIFAVQDAIAEKVTAALKVQVSAAERERVYRRYTENVAAYELYLRGRAAAVTSSAEGLHDAIADYEDALKLDPNYVLADAGLATACAPYGLDYAPEAERQFWEDRAKREAERALQLDPNLAEAHLALAAIYRFTDFEWERAIEESGRALELNPNLEEPHHYRAVAFEHLGLFDLAEPEARAGVEVNPQNGLNLMRVLANAAFYEGRYDQSVALWEQYVQRAGSQVPEEYLARAYFYAGEREHAESMLTGARAQGVLTDEENRALLASFLAARGEHGRAEALLKDLTAMTKVIHHAAYYAGDAYAQMGEPQRARLWLARAAESGFPCYPWYARDPLLDPLRGDPEFQRFMADLHKSWEAARARYGSNMQSD